jgi:hypothetical protein
MQRGRSLRRRYGRAKVASGPAELVLDDALAARRISTAVSKTLGGARTEVWVVHPHGDPGASVLQVQLFKPGADKVWTAWTGQYVRSRDSQLAARVAVKRSEHT